MLRSSGTRISPPKNPFAFAWYISLHNKWWAIAAVCAVVLAQLLSSSLAVVLKFIIDAASATFTSGGGDFMHALFMGMLYPLTFFLAENVWRMSGFAGMQWITQARAVINRMLFAYLTDHSSTYFNKRFAGALTNKISNASQGTGRILSSFLWEFFPLGIAFIVDITIAFFAHAFLGLILSIWILLFLTVSFVLVRRKQPYSYAVAEKYSILKGKMVDAATNISAVHQSGHHEYERQYVDRFIEDHRKADHRSWWLSEWILFANGTLITLFIGGVIGMSLFLLFEKVITLGTVVMAIHMALDIQGSLFFIGGKMTEFMDNYGEVQEGLEEILQPHDIEDVTNAVPLVVREGVVEFGDVTFSYGRRNVFEGLYLRLGAGQKVGLVGMSGAGKTTLVSILLRQYDVQSGHIFIDGQDIAAVTRESLRRAIAVVPQDVSLFHRTIRENIRYGRLDATDDEIVRAASLAQAHDFISTLPKGYDTYVGERGVRLSGGQRQRIAIARAILKDAGILVLDEATSSLDSESEAAIQKALAELMKGKTVLAIAHRLSTLQAMDRIVVLEQGRVAEDGTHQELLKHEGIYKRLWESQVRGFI